MKVGKASKTSGFSLIEVLIALLILSVGLLAIAQLQAVAINTLAGSRHMTSAVYLAEKQLEYLRSLPLDPPMPNTPPPEPLDIAGNPILDAEDRSVLLDDSAGDPIASMGDGLPSPWHVHRDLALNEQGLKAKPGEMKYYVRWQVERGPATTAGVYDALTGKMTLPAQGQIRIRLQVFWWDNTKKKPPLTSADDIKNITETAIRNSGGHVIEMATIRQSTL